MHHSNDTNECICGVNHHHTVKCNSTLNEISILDCYQMTLDEQLEQVVVRPSIAMAFIPLTIFYILVLVVQFNANSPSLHGFVIVTQIISTPDLIKIGMATSNERAKHAVKVIATIYGIWNLDFFRAFSPDICLSISTLQIVLVTLDYVIAFYPLLLILLTYVCMKLYSKDYKIFVWLWRSFR